MEILGDAGNRVFEKRDGDGKLIGVSVVHKDTIYLLCVDREYRGCGIGSELLELSERYIRDAGFAAVTVGAGEDYLAPGVPTSRAFYKIEGTEALYDGLDDHAAEFFRKRGYVHSWEDCDCFDMRFPLTEFVPGTFGIGDTSDGITYRFATAEDIPEIKKCTDNAHEKFTKYYLDEGMYNGSNGQRILIALDGETVCGTLMVCAETEGKGIGSVGCTTVHHDYRGRHIAVNMVRLRTGYLKTIGMTDAYLGYTYTGLDRMYGYSGYKICTYYMMAKKKL